MERNISASVVVPVRMFRTMFVLTVDGQRREKIMVDSTEMCWNTGDFRDGCDCMTCEHRYECSGSDLTDDDDE